MKIYISGKIGNLPKEIYERKFWDAENEVRSVANINLFGREIETVNPCTLDHAGNATYKDYMMKDIDALFDCDGIFMLNNWKDSKGARIEHAIAIEMGLKIWYQNDA
jgi:hypothetical protein